MSWHRWPNQPKTTWLGQVAGGAYAPLLMCAVRPLVGGLEANTLLAGL